MFYGASAFNQPIDRWNVSNVVNMNKMFYGAVSFNQPIGEWDISYVVGMANMFYGAQAFSHRVQWMPDDVPENPDEDN
jgi:surface protein